MLWSRGVPVFRRYGYYRGVYSREILKSVLFPRFIFQSFYYL